MSAHLLSCPSRLKEALEPPPAKKRRRAKLDQNGGAIMAADSASPSTMHRHFPRINIQHTAKSLQLTVSQNDFGSDSEILRILPKEFSILSGTIIVPTASGENKKFIRLRVNLQQ
jgi:hypothetical protein